MNIEHIFSPEEHELSRSIQSLTPESSEAQIKSTFVGWCKEVLTLILDDIIKTLRTKLQWFERQGEECVRCNHERIDYIKRAIRALEAQKLVAFDAIDDLAQDSTLDQFLTIMGLIDHAFPGSDWFPISYGMKDAGLIDRYHNELWPAVTFRYNQARRISRGAIDTSFSDVVVKQWKIHRVKKATASLGTLGSSEENDLAVLQEYFDGVLHPLICRIIAMDEKQIANWGILFKKVRPGGDNGRSTSIDLASGLLELKGVIKSYLSSLPPESTSNPSYESARAELFEAIDVLQPHLIKLQTREKTGKARTAKQ